MKVFTLADNQRPIATALDAAGIVALAGDAAALSDGAIRAAAADFLADPARLHLMSRASAALCDGHGAERVAVDYRPLPAMTTEAAACAAGMPDISAEVPGNLCLDWRTGDRAAVERAFAGATHVVSLSLDKHKPRRLEG